MSDKILFIEWCAKDALDGTSQMAPLTELAYRRILDMIYSTNDQLLDDDSVLQYSTKTGSKWKAIKKELIEVHKKITIEDGRIRHHVCTEKLAKSQRQIDQKSEAGKASAEARKALKNNNPPPTAVQTAVAACEPTSEPTDEPTNQKPNNQSSKLKHPDLLPREEGGVLKNRKGEERKPFSIEHRLTDAGVVEAKRAAPGWDLYHLMRIYNEGIDSGQRDPPTHPDKAFAAWCQRYTKGQRP